MKNLIIIALLLVLILLQGCSVSASIGVGADIYYPEGKTAKGGSFGDPSESRRQKTAPTTGHMRNNDDSTGNKVDEALRKFFKTK
jgi:predicted small secreted protein